MKLKGSAGCNQQRVLTWLQSWDWLTQGLTLTALANTINNAFLAPMNSFSPLHPEASGDVQHTNPPTVTEFSVLKKLPVLIRLKPQGRTAYLRAFWKKEGRHTAQVVIDVSNCSYSEARLPQSWKEADIAPVPKQTPVYDVNKHLRSISLTPLLSFPS